ncbi:hypothetical protein V7S43_010585 [Phytophthora oleae]|uniref:Uncharacterized protein n=1 Tax=Phytophthora oleae TaxID=2107226 RepID=A0ABD3FC03_9STRA
MHCKRVLLNDEVAAEERGVNLWDFSAKNSIQPPTETNSFADIISAFATLHKFAQEFYNPVTADFIATARDFMINYNDHAKSDPSMARLLTFWVNGKFILFRSRLATLGLEVAAQFTRSDDKLAALRDSQHLLASSVSSGKQRQHGQDRSQRSTKQGSGFIPPTVFNTPPKAEDG